MGICVRCIYCGDPKEPRRFKCNNEFHRRKLIDPRMFGEDFFCTNQNNIETDFITGKEYFGSCRNKNAFEECLYFDDGSVALFAWSSSELTVFTKVENPSKDTPYFDDKGNELGAITNVISLYTWINGDVTVYTLTPTPSEDYDILDINGNKIGVISSVTDTTISVKVNSDISTLSDDIPEENEDTSEPSDDAPITEEPEEEVIIYNRDESLDFINAGVEVSSKSCYRDINKDTSYIPEESEDIPEDNTDIEPPNNEDTPSDTVPSGEPEDNTDESEDDPDLPDELPDDIDPVAP